MKVFLRHIFDGMPEALGPFLHFQEDVQRNMIFEVFSLFLGLELRPRGLARILHITVLGRRIARGLTFVQ